MHLVHIHYNFICLYGIPSIYSSQKVEIQSIPLSRNPIRFFPGPDQIALFSLQFCDCLG